MAPAPSMRPLAKAWTTPVERPSSLVSATKVRLLNEDGDIARPSDWTASDRSRLWLYTLHYFDDLAAPACREKDLWRRALVSRWIAENPPAAGVGWEPYPTSRRIVNWIKWALSGAPMAPAWLQSLAIQTRALEQRLEWRLLGNHLLANAKALIFAGLFFEGAEAIRWLSRGLALWSRELGEQILPDGGHFERSPMYGALVLEDILDVMNLARAFGAPRPEVIEDWAAVADRMRTWLAAMTHPDGEIGYFNDAASGIAPRPGALDAYVQRLGLPGVNPPRQGATWLETSGYGRLATADAVALLDIAPVGPDHLPGHATRIRCRSSSPSETSGSSSTAARASMARVPSAPSNGPPPRTARWRSTGETPPRCGPASASVGARGCGTSPSRRTMAP